MTVQKWRITQIVASLCRRRLTTPLRLYANYSGAAQAVNAFTTASPICAVPTLVVPSL